MATTPLITSKAPNLPIGPVDYSQQFQDQFSNVLRLYFAQVDNLNQVVAERVTTEGISFPDGTYQTTAWQPSYVEAYSRSNSIAITTTQTLLLPDSYIPATAVGITYDTATGVFTFEHEGVYSLSITLNINTSTANQEVYVYAQKNIGSGWVNTTNSGKTYQLTNGDTVQFVTSQSVYRAAGEQTRYYIYSNGNTSSLTTQTLPGVSPTVYVPAIRIQYSGG